jgi:hypothetical protein
MLDPPADAVALSELVTALAGASFPDPALAVAQQDAVDAVAANGDAALLGALSGHLLVHADSDGAELQLLRRAATLWGHGTRLIDDLGAIRADLEGAMEDPAAPGAADRFNDAAVRAQELTNAVNALRPDVDELRADALAFPHLPPHPRQTDTSADGWDWGNRVHGRRTDALVRALLDRAQDPQGRAFAVGAASAYGANAAGSAYLGHTVGGPRRSHRHRDRLGRNAIGAWLAANHPAATTPSAMAAAVAFGPVGQPALPPGLEQLLGSALAATFDLGATTPVPDLQAGHARLVEHLTLLDRFPRPAPPAPPGTVWMATLYADPASPPPTLRPQDVDVVGQDGGGVAVQYGAGPAPGSQQPGKDDSSGAGAVCGIIVAILILVDVLQAFVQCCGQWANSNPCTFWDNMLLKKVWEEDPPDPTDPTGPKNPDMTAQGLTAAAAVPQAAQLVSMLFDAHNTLWEAMDRALTFLAMTGLVLPTGLLGLPVFAQFTTIPEREVQEWPAREEPNPVDTYHLPPTTPVERPERQPSPHGAGAPPTAFLPQATADALTLWSQNAAGLRDTDNLDLDADRGFGHLCWRTDGSVNDDPIGVAVLDYEDQS